MAVNFIKEGGRVLKILGPIATLGILSFGAIDLFPLTGGYRLGRQKYTEGSSFAQDEKGHASEKPLRFKTRGVTVHDCASATVPVIRKRGNKVLASFPAYDNRPNSRVDVPHASIYPPNQRRVELDSDHPDATFIVAGVQIGAHFHDMSEAITR